MCITAHTVLRAKQSHELIVALLLTGIKDIHGGTQLMVNTGRIGAEGYTFALKRRKLLLLKNLNAEREQKCK